MADICLVKDGGKLIPFAPDDADALQKMPNGQVIKCKYSIPRNLAFHRKFFSLINLAFEYIKPSFSLVTKAERFGVNGFAKFIAENSPGNEELMKSLASEYIASLEKNRLTRFGEPTPCKTAFRKEVIVKAGYYDLVSTPDGPTRVAKSISFGSMDNNELAELYKACFNVLWTEVLNDVFESEDDAEMAVNHAMNQLMSYA